MLVFSLRLVLVLVLFFSLYINPVFAKKKSYLDAKLLDLNIDSKTLIGYRTDTSTDGFFDCSDSNNSKQKNNFHRTSLTTTSVTTPVIQEDNTYYFKVALDGKIYESYFRPTWKQRIDTNWIIGNPVQVRFNKKFNRLYLKKPSGGDLKTKIFNVRV